MFSIFFGGRCFREQESSLFLVTASKSEAAASENFFANAIEHIIVNDELTDEYRSKSFAEVTDEDESVKFMKEMIDDMNLTVVFRFEAAERLFAMKPLKWNENIIGAETEHNYVLLYWCTRA